MLDVFPLDTELACPPTIRQLQGDMLGRIAMHGVDGDLVEPEFEFSGRADFIAQRAETFSERL